MTKADLTNHLAYTLGLTKSEARSAVDTIFNGVIDALGRGEDVKITDFASFKTVVTPPRKYRNQVTGEMEMSQKGKRVKVSFSRRVVDAISGDLNSTDSGTLISGTSDELDDPEDDE